MPILLGTLLPGAIPIGYGHRAPRKGFARIHSGADVAVVVKSVPPPEFAAEMFCAKLGLLMGLPMPEPIIVLDPIQSELLAGSLDAGYPNLLQRFEIDPRNPDQELIAVVAKRLAQWSIVHAVVGFDEWIQNVDRNLQNILWDGHDRFVLIDHGQTLGLVQGDRNKLLDMVLGVTEPKNTDPLRQAVIGAARRFSSDPTQTATQDVSQSPIPDAAQAAGAFSAFVASRLPILAALLQRRFPPSPQLGLDLEDQDVRDG